MSNEKHADCIFRLFWEWRLNNAPEFATSIGMHKYDNRLDEMSLNSYSRRFDGARKLLEYLQEYQKDAKDLPADVKLNIDLIVSDLQQYVDGAQFKAYLCTLNNLEGPHHDFPRLLSWMKKDSVDDVKMIIGRLRLLVQQVDEIIFLLKEGIRLGFVMHEVSVAGLPQVLREMVDVPTYGSVLFKPFIEKPRNITDDGWNQLVTEAIKVIEGDVNPSFIKLSDFIKDVYLAHTRKSIAASSLPNGEQYYAACLKFHTTTTLTAKEVHDIGLKEVERIRQRMMDVKEQLKYEGTLKDFLTYLRTDAKFSYKEEAEILEHYKDVCREIEKKLSEYFHVLPKTPYDIIPMPREVAATFAGAYYDSPPVDGSRPGTFNINTYNPEFTKKYDAVSLSMHEAVPGHHLQICLTMESGSSPDFRRFNEDVKEYEAPGHFATYTSFVEGWALYAEYLGEEMGLYSDLYDMFGRLSNEMLRACRLVVDTGMHAFGWSRQQAIEYMESNVALEIHEITSEIDRYITWPGQACAYKIGEIKIKEIREKAEKMLGNEFDLRTFHHVIASMGRIPLDILESQIDIFIDKQLQ